MKSFSAITFVLAISLAALAGCGGAEVEVGGRTSEEKGAKLGSFDENSRCEVGDGREVLVDLNQDEVADVRKVYRDGGDGELLACREADLNFDGTKDLFVFFDPETGEKKRDEIDLDYDGRIDVVTLFVEGKQIKQELDTNSDGKIDRVRYLDDEIPLRVEGDTDGDGRVDYWEYYEAGKLIRIGVDEDGDGTADDWNRDQETEEAALAEGDEGEGAADEEGAGAAGAEGESESAEEG